MVVVCRFSSIDVSVAVATEGGLITPIVKGADEKSVIEIGKDMKDLAGAVLPNSKSVCFVVHACVCVTSHIYSPCSLSSTCNMQHGARRMHNTCWYLDQSPTQQQQHRTAATSN